MPTLAPPILPVSRPAPSQETGLPPVSFFGRSLGEYTQFFGLDPAALRGRDILDVGAGSSSFTAEACARKIHAVAVDPLYGHSLAELSAQVQRDQENLGAELRAKRRMIPLGSFPSPAAAETDRRAAAQRFLTDYEAHFIHNRYVTGALPRLPFFDGTFDLVLCAHLLFSCAKRFDLDWHLAACRELVRVSAEEVRIHPLCSLEGKPFPGLGRLRRELREQGIASSLRAVGSDGTTSMLVLRGASP